MAKKSSFSHLVALLLLLALGVCQAKRISYSGYALYRLLPQTGGQIEALQALRDNSEDADIRFWTEPRSLNMSVDVMVSPEDQDSLVSELKKSGIPMTTMMADVGKVITKTSVTTDFHHRSHYQNLFDPLVFHTRYHPYKTIESKLMDLASKDDSVQVSEVGFSSERRKMYLVKISSDHSANKPVIFFDAGHHAREWISHATLLYIMDSLVNEAMPRPVGLKSSDAYLNASESSDERKLITSGSLKSYLKKYDFWFLPVVNPDGYEYTQSTDRLWRKTRSRGTFCIGADPNRNYPFHWRENGASYSPCSDIYAGSKPLSEPETEILARILKKHQDRIRMYVTLHAYSQLILTPYGYTYQLPSNYAEMERIAKAGIAAITAVRGTRYRFGTASNVLYLAAGGSDDYAIGTANIRIAYTIELPDAGNKGFLLPPEEIVPVGFETVAGLGAMLDAL